MPVWSWTRRALLALLCTAVAGVGLVACGGDGGNEASPYCERIGELSDLDLLADPTPAAVQRDLEGLLALTRRAAAVAPEEIRADMREAVDAQVRFNQLYESHGWDPATTQRDPEFIAFAGDAHLAEVYTRLEHYEVRECPHAASTRPTIAPA